MYHPESTKGLRNLMAATIPIIDCHTHLVDLATIAGMNAIADHLGLARINLVCTIDPRQVNENPAAFVAKAEFPCRYTLFAGLDHTPYYLRGETDSAALAAQVDRLAALGADGIKMLEAKPTSRKFLDVPVDGTYFAPFFRRVEETGMPLIWHVADPEEFWDPEKTPAWAREQGWGYDETCVAKEQLYREVGNVLQRYPKLKVVFAHFYFLSADLDRAAALMDRYENVHFDLAPGIELLYNLSRDTEKPRRFFCKYADRILFGTDICSNQPPAEAALRAGIVTRWLETAEEYRVPAGADFLLGPASDGVMHGLSLPEDVLAKIYHANFERLAGKTPRPMDRELAARECDRLAIEVSTLTGVAVSETQAGAAAARLRA